MLSNPFKDFATLFGRGPREYGVVTAIDGARIVVQQPSGATVRILGTAQVGAGVFYRGDLLESVTPVLANFAEQEE